MTKPIKIKLLRMCCACRAHKERNLLNRFVVKDGSIILDYFYKQPGRGAYLCKNIDCLKKAKKTKSLSRALSVNINDDLYDYFEKDFFR